MTSAACEFRVLHDDRARTVDPGAAKPRLGRESDRTDGSNLLNFIQKFKRSLAGETGADNDQGGDFAGAVPESGKSVEDPACPNAGKVQCATLARQDDPFVAQRETRSELAQSESDGSSASLSAAIVATATAQMGISVRSLPADKARPSTAKDRSAGDRLHSVTLPSARPDNDVDCSNTQLFLGFAVPVTLEHAFDPLRVPQPGPHCSAVIQSSQFSSRADLLFKAAGFTPHSAELATEARIEESPSNDSKPTNVVNEGPVLQQKVDPGAESRFGGAQAEVAHVERDFNRAQALSPTTTRIEGEERIARQQSVQQQPYDATSAWKRSASSRTLPAVDHEVKATNTAAVPREPTDKSQVLHTASRASDMPAQQAIHESAKAGRVGGISANETFAAIDSAEPNSSATAARWVHASPRSAEAGYMDPAIGWVSVRAHADPGGVHAVLIPSSPTAAEVLNAHLPALNAHLASEHPDLNRVTLSSSTESENYSGGPAGSHQQQQGDGAGQKEDRNAEREHVRSPYFERIKSPPAERDDQMILKRPPVIPGGSLRVGSHISVMA